MMFLQKSSEENKILNLVFFFVFICFVSFADLESFSPAGVDYKAEIQGHDDNKYIIRTYTSQIVNCKRKNETYNADVGFNTSDHTGKKYNISFSVNRIEYKTENMASWGSFTTDSTEVSERVKDYNFYISNMNNLKGNYSELYIRIVFRKYNLSCVNREYTEGNNTYWMHSYLMAPETSLGGEVGDEYRDYESIFIWDGQTLSTPARIVIEAYELPTVEKVKTSIDIKIKIYDDRHGASYYNELSSDKLYLHVQMLESNLEDYQSEFGEIPLNNFNDVVGGIENYCMMTYNFTDSNANDYLNDYFFKFAFEVWLQDVSDIVSNTEFGTLGKLEYITGNTYYRIYESVTSGGTINARLYQIQRQVLPNNDWIYTFVNDDNIEWEIMGESFTGNVLVYNPYKSNNPRDVPRSIYITAKYKGYTISSYVYMPKLGESKQSEVQAENENEIPPEEDLEIVGDEFDSTNNVSQTNEILNELLNEFKNGRDEALNFQKGVIDFIESADNYNKDLSVVVPEMGGGSSGEDVEGGITGGLGEILGDGNSYGDGVDDGFGNGVGGNINQFENIGEKDMSFTIDLRDCYKILPCDTSEWVWTFSLYPDTSTEVGQGIERIVKQYVRPLFLFFLWLIMGINCVKDISSFFGNNSNV